MIWRLSRCYPTRWLRNYAIGKIATDPAYRAVGERLRGSDLPVLDVGCGIGLCAAYLRERGYTAPIQGFDPDPEKIEAAQFAARRYPDLQFTLGSAQELPPFSGHVLMIDVLHYFAPDVLPQVLTQLAQRVAPGGWCLMRFTPNDGSWRYRCTRTEERFAQAIRWMRHAPVWFPTVEEVTGPFVQLGLTVEVRPLWGLTPFNSYWFAFHRPAATGSLDNKG